MLSDFFRINLPYGLARNKKGEWMAFNREYMPLGYNNSGPRTLFFPKQEIPDLPVYTKYTRVTEKILLSVAARNGEAVKRDENGKIYAVWLYHDEGRNLLNQTGKTNPFWDEYWKKLQILSKLKVE